MKTTVKEIMAQKKCYRALSCKDLLGWAYLKLFLANMLMIGLCYSWANLCPDLRTLTSITVSSGISSVTGIMNCILSGIFLFGCNQKKPSELKPYYVFSQFFMTLVAASLLYSLSGIGVFISKRDYLQPMDRWIYQSVNIVIQIAVLIVDIHIFGLVGKVMKTKTPILQPIYVQKTKDGQCLLKGDDSYDEDVEKAVARALKNKGLTNNNKSNKPVLGA